MKKLQIFMVFFFLSAMFYTAFGQYAKIEGRLLYNYDGSKPLNDCKVECKNQNGGSLGVYTTEYDATFGDGYYYFDISQSGTYYISLTDDPPNPPYEFGGINSIDAMMISQYILGSISFDDLQKEAADVMCDNDIDDDDWTEVCLRYVGSI